MTSTSCSRPSRSCSPAAERTEPAPRPSRSGRLGFKAGHVAAECGGDASRAAHAIDHDGLRRGDGCRRPRCGRRMVPAGPDDRGTHPWGRWAPSDRSVRGGASPSAGGAIRRPGHHRPPLTPPTQPRPFRRGSRAYGRRGDRARLGLPERRSPRPLDELCRALLLERLSLGHLVDPSSDPVTVAALIGRKPPRSRPAGTCSWRSPSSSFPCARPSPSDRSRIGR
jgi:hypothetical protein